MSWGHVDRTTTAHCAHHSAQTSSGNLLPSHFWNRNPVRNILPGLRRKITELLLSGPKSSFQKKNNILHFTRRSRSGVWRKIGEASVRFPKSVMIWGAVMSAGVGLLCFIKHKVNAAVYREILEHFMLSSAEKLYGDADFLFQQEFSTCPECQNHFQVVCWQGYYCAWLASQHAWPDPHLESMGYFQEKDEMQSIPTIQTSWRLNSAQAVPHADRFHATPHWCWSLC